MTGFCFDSIKHLNLLVGCQTRLLINVPYARKKNDWIENKWKKMWNVKCDRRKHTRKKRRCFSYNFPRYFHHEKNNNHSYFRSVRFWTSSWFGSHSLSLSLEKYLFTINWTPIYWLNVVRSVWMIWAANWPCHCASNACSCIRATGDKFYCYSK